MCKLHSCLTQNKDKISVLTSNIPNTVGQFIVPTSECCDCCITQEVALIFSLYIILQEFMLQMAHYRRTQQIKPLWHHWVWWEKRIILNHQPKSSFPYSQGKETSETESRLTESRRLEKTSEIFESNLSLDAITSPATTKRHVLNRWLQEQWFHHLPGIPIQYIITP